MRLQYTCPHTHITTTVEAPDKPDASLSEWLEPVRVLACAAGYHDTTIETYLPEEAPR